ncbi:hypothetical protein [Massilia sp.]|uniref:hypothetical protein n=1 Tax=Massilia sp. TaxID=1882437 RepID=UPI0028993164|nr:hypothetical protein [Massilia sp.]
MNMTASTQAPAPVTPRRRFDDHALPDRPLEWDDEGTPLASTTFVYPYRPRNEQFKRWADIRTEEHLLDVQAAPERYELRILFTVPVEYLARAPLAHVAMARTRLDTIQRAAGAAIANMRAVACELKELS